MKPKSAQTAIALAIGNIQECLSKVSMDYEKAFKVTEELHTIELVLDEFLESTHHKEN
jgi:hypothetical protein